MGAMDTDTAPHTTPDERSFESELEAYLDTVARADAYEVVERLGTGDTELVRFRGANGASLGPFVRKQIDLASGLGGAYEALFDAQRAGRRFTHLPRMVECYRTATQIVAISEYVPGDTLEAYVRSHGASPAAARLVFPALCEAVTELHGACTPPIIHRDLKPQNVIVAEQGLFLIDFGIARQVRTDAVADTTHFGTRAWAPPEQYGFGQTDARSDVYALGMLLAFCLTGMEPAGAHRTFRDWAPLLGNELASVVARATALDPAVRYQSADEVRRAYLAADAGAPGVLNVNSLVSNVPAEASWSRGVSSGYRGAARDTKVPGTNFSSVGWGHLRNLCLLLAGLAFVPYAARDVLQPSGAGVGKPLWYLLIFNFGLLLPIIWGALYLLVDRRALARLLPSVGRRSRRRDAFVIAVYLVSVFMLLVIASVLADIV